MKLLTTITLALITSSSLFAQTTMCFKENHNSMSTIESTKLDGGECKSKFTINDMKTKGWSVDDIKITTKESKYNFIYILKKGNSSINLVTPNSNLNEKQLEDKILKRLEDKKIQEEKELKIERVIKSRVAGKEMYIAKCQSCHGNKAEKTPYNTSRALNTLNHEEISLSIRNYSNGDNITGYEMIMKPYADMLNKQKIKEVYEYIQTLKTMESK
jgi:cytochrome c553